jgi:hypothetical protein
MNNKKIIGWGNVEMWKCKNGAISNLSLLFWNNGTVEDIIKII